MFCSNCGNEVSEKDLFCEECGASLREAEASAEDPAQVSDGASETSVVKRKKRWTGVIFVAIAIVLIGSVIGVILWGNQKAAAEREKEYQKELRKGARYLDDMDYERAVVAYKAAIEIDPKNPEPYIGMADAYLGLGDYESARDILEEGYDETEDGGIRRYLRKIEDALKTEVDVYGTVAALDGGGGNIAGARVSMTKYYGRGYNESTVTDTDGKYSGLYDPETDKRIVDLDLDDTQSYGPETTTIYMQRDADYVFGVYNYSRGSNTELAKSGAVVQVYDGDASAPKYVFYVPQERGYFWEVFRYDGRNGTLVPTNHMMAEYTVSDYLGY